MEVYSSESSGIIHDGGEYISLSEVVREALWLNEMWGARFQADGSRDAL